MTYVSGLPGSSKLGGHASAKELAQRTAWRAHAASTLGDLVVGVNLFHLRRDLILFRPIHSIRPPIIGNSSDRPLRG